MSVICPICYKSETEGTLFCPECGTKMFLENGLFTTILNPTKGLSEKTQDFNLPVFQDEANIDNQISLRIINTGHILPLMGQEEFLLGRVSEGQSLFPDVDLTPFDAQKFGVSRLHALIQIKGNEVFLSDLNSSNGTKLNNDRIEPRVKHIINNADVIKLGKLKILAQLREE